MLSSILETDNRKPKIVVAMSGGVDSSMVAYLLAKMGYELVGFTAWTLNGPGKCCNDALINAGQVCEMLGIPYDTLDLRREFAHYVMEHYENSYKAGLTPNPCVECNRYIKWEKLVAYAREELEADYVATGHYAKIQHNKNSSVQVFRGSDPKKDQTYMLSRVKPEDLRYTLFPLGSYKKSDIVAMAREVNIPTAFSKESQDVCFVLNGQANYLAGILGKKKGEIVDYETGKVLGEHDGHYLFTRGQRKGVKVAAGRPIYVIHADPQTNRVYLGDPHHLESREFIAKDISWINEPQGEQFDAMVKIRYNSRSFPAECLKIGKDDLHVIFKSPVSAITHGQIAAIYDSSDNELFGGGYIENYLKHKEFTLNRSLPEFDETCGLFR